MTDDLSDFEQELRHRISTQDLFGIEKTLGLPRQLFASLLDEPSDWSFVIKLAVMLEAALTQVISSRLDTPELQRHLARLNLDGRTGKLQLAIDLGVIDQIVAAGSRGQCNASSNTSAGVLNPRVFRGLVFNLLAISSS
jgi:hypothetical protein